MVMGRVLLSRRRALSESADGHGGLNPTENRSQGEGVPQGCIRREGGGGLGPKSVGTKNGPTGFSQRQLSFSPTMVPLVWGGGGAPHTVHGHSNTFLWEGGGGMHQKRWRGGQSGTQKCVCPNQYFLP